MRPAKTRDVERLTLGQFSDDDLLTCEETSQVLNVSPHTLSDWRWRGRGPKATRCGRLVRYFARDIRAFLVTTQVGSATAEA